jgi:hypothetical protein
MQKLIVIIAAGVALAGCATPGPGPANYGTRGYAQSGDPSQWQVVSVTPVPLGTGARAGDAGVVTSSPVVVDPAPASPVYVPQPAYPVYAPAPVVVQDPYWYPPISIGLGFNFGRSWGGHRHHHHRGHFRRR